MLDRIQFYALHSSMLHGKVMCMGQMMRLGDCSTFPAHTQFHFAIFLSIMLCLLHCQTEVVLPPLYLIYLIKLVAFYWDIIQFKTTIIFSLLFLPSFLLPLLPSFLLLLLPSFFPFFLLPPPPGLPLLSIIQHFMCFITEYISLQPHRKIKFLCRFFFPKQAKADLFPCLPHLWGLGELIIDDILNY